MQSVDESGEFNWDWAQDQNRRYAHSDEQLKLDLVSYSIFPGDVSFKN